MIEYQEFDPHLIYKTRILMTFKMNHVIKILRNSKHKQVQFKEKQEKKGRVLKLNE